MTLERLNRTNPVPVIDRTDDSREAPIRIAVYGKRGFFLDVLIEAIQRSGFTTWRAEWPADDTAVRDADLAVVVLDGEGYSSGVRRLIRNLAAAERIAVAIDAESPAAGGRSWTPAGTIWAVDPALTTMDELVETIAAAARHPNAEAARRRRAVRAGDAWDTTTKSSILTMRPDPDIAEDAAVASRAASRADGGSAASMGEGDGGRHLW